MAIRYPGRNNARDRRQDIYGHNRRFRQRCIRLLVTSKGKTMHVTLTKDGYDDAKYDTTLGQDGKPAASPPAMEKVSNKGKWDDLIRISLIIFIIILVVLMVIVFGMFLLKRKKPVKAQDEAVVNKDEEQEDEEPEEEVTGDEAEDESVVTKEGSDDADGEEEKPDQDGPTDETPEEDADQPDDGSQDVNEPNDEDVEVVGSEGPNTGKDVTNSDDESPINEVKKGKTAKKGQRHLRDILNRIERPGRTSTGQR